MVLLDCYQSTGTVPVDVTALGVDFACGGSVKWLCGGPGAAYLYVRPDRIAQFRRAPPAGSATRSRSPSPCPSSATPSGVWRYMAGTPAVAALYQARAGAEIVAEIGVDKIRAKSLRQTAQHDRRAATRPARRVNTPRAEPSAAARSASTSTAPTASPRRSTPPAFCATRRPQSGIRMSPHFYTTDEEVERFLDEVERLQGTHAREHVTAPINPRELARAARLLATACWRRRGRMLAHRRADRLGRRGQAGVRRFRAAVRAGARQRRRRAARGRRRARGSASRCASTSPTSSATSRAPRRSATPIASSWARTIRRWRSLQVADLLEPGALVEIEGLAVIG